MDSSTSAWRWHQSLLISFPLKTSRCSSTEYWCKHSDFLQLQLKAAFDHISSSYRFIFITLLLLFLFLVKSTIFSLKTRYSQNTSIEIKMLRNRFLLGKSLQIKIPLFKMLPRQQCFLRNLHENSLIISKKITSPSGKGSEVWLLYFIFLSDVTHFVSHALSDHHLWENATWNKDEPMNSSWQR